MRPTPERITSFIRSRFRKNPEKYVRRKGHDHENQIRKNTLPSRISGRLRRRRRDTLPAGQAVRRITGKQTFTILHTNDLHSNFIGMAPATDYTPFTLNDDMTSGGYARLATLIAKRKAARRPKAPC